jgi:hypothetical protein
MVRHPLGDLGTGVGVSIEDSLDRCPLGLPELAHRHRQHGYQIAR